MLGLVAVEGTRAPYIIAIEDQQYGGDRTRGEPSYVYRGAIYVRRGANSVIANRQSEVLEIVNKAQQAATDNGQPDEFLTTHNYLDVKSEDFGRHVLSNRLVEEGPKADAPGAEYVPAQSWVSFVFHLFDSGCEIKTAALKEKLRPDQRIGREGKWYHGVPRSFIDMFCNPRATPRKFLGTWQPRDSQNAGEISHFIRIQPSGHIEIGCTYPLFYQRDGIRFFGFVALIGYLWQMIYLSRAIYRDADFYGETAILVNLIGTKGTRLAYFAPGWPSPFSPAYWLILTSPEQEICHDPNIQIERRLLLAAASDEEIEAMIREIARDIGAYYGQDRPRCFDCQTDEFPHRDYTQRV